jgi:prepilin-type processing-associated H-X9-DG protein
VNESLLSESAVTLLNGDGDPSQKDAGGSAYNVIAGTGLTAPQFGFEDIKNKPNGGKKHLEGANYSFADGHVKWWTPEKISGSITSSSDPTFAIN